MGTSIFLIKFWGWYCVVFFFMLIINPKNAKQILNDLKDQRFLVIISFIAIVMGLLNILFHNIWEPTSKLLVTLFGWFALLKGVFLFTFPKRAITMLENMSVKRFQLMYLLLLFIGLFLLNEAYGVVLY